MPLLPAESILRDVARLIVWYPVRWLLGILPVAASARLLEGMGCLHQLAGCPAVEEGLRCAFGEQGPPGGLDRAVGDHLRMHYLDRLHIFLYPRFSRGEWNRLLMIEGEERLEQALTQGRGAILLHGHYGPIQLPLFALAHRGYPVCQLGLPSDEGLSLVGRRVAYRLRLRLEGMIPAEILSAERYLRPVVRQLKGNGVVMLTGDGNVAGRQVGRHEAFAFLGHRLEFPVGAFSLQARTGAALLPLSLEPLGNGRWKAVIHPPLPAPTDDSRESIRHSTRQFLGWFEGIVRARPGPWHFWDQFRPGLRIVQ